MNFNRGDQVVHHSFGVGTVISIEGIKFTGDEPHQYYRMEFNKTTIWVPVFDPPPRGLRHITPKSQLYRYRGLLKQTPVQLDEDLRLRQKDLEQRIDLGTFKSLCEMVRDLTAWVQSKPMNKFEKSLLKQARESLVGEWPAASKLTLDEALNEIDGLLLTGKQSVISD